MSKYGDKSITLRERFKRGLLHFKDIVVAASAASPAITVVIALMALVSTPFTGPVGVAIGVSAIAGLVSAVTGLIIDTLKLKKINSLERENALLSATIQHRNNTRSLLALHPELKVIAKESTEKLFPLDVKSERKKSHNSTYKELTTNKKRFAMAKYIAGKYVLPVTQFICNTIASVGVFAIAAVLKLTGSGIATAIGAGLEAKVLRSTLDVCNTLNKQIHDMSKEVHGYDNIHELENITRQEYIRNQALRGLTEDPKFSTMDVDARRAKFNELVDKYDNTVSKDKLKPPSILRGMFRTIEDICVSQNPFSKNWDPEKIRVDAVPPREDNVQPHAQKRKLSTSPKVEKQIKRFKAADHAAHPTSPQTKASNTLSY